MTVKSRKTTTTTTTIETSPVLQFAEADDTFPYRLVGSYEYGTSLTDLGKLVDSSTTEQIAVYDKLIELNPEYSFFSDSDLKASLAWMMALARVELGATMSMYGNTDDPFGATVRIGGAEFGATEYLQILVNDLAIHLKAAQLDPNYRKSLSFKEKVDASSLAHLRRTQLINDLLNKVISSGDSDLISQATPYTETAQKYVDQMVGKITAATTRQRRSGSQEYDSGVNSRLTGVRFNNRTHLRNCQIRLEQIYGPPSDLGSPLQ